MTPWYNIIKITKKPRLKIEAKLLILFGGDEGIRTPDLYVANAAAGFSALF